MADLERKNYSEDYTDNYEGAIPNTRGFNFIRTVGYSRDDLVNKPVIGIANAWSDVVPGHNNLRQVAEAVKRGIYMAGGIAAEYGVSGVCDAAVNEYVLPTRDVICDSIELETMNQHFDGLVMIGSCDKIVPGMIMAACRMKDVLPSLIVTGGPALLGRPFKGKTVIEFEFRKEMLKGLQNGSIKREAVAPISDCGMVTCGACCYYGTANTMSAITEAIGLQLPSGGTIPAVFYERLILAEESGKAIVNLVKNGKKGRDILTFEALQNAIAVLMATGGSTNGVLHTLAIANELELDPDAIIHEFEIQSKKVPVITAIYPEGPESNPTETFHYAGGVPRVFEYLNKAGLINPNVLTVSGKTLGENIKEHIYVYQGDWSDVIRPADNPFSKEGGLAILRGNLAPDTAVCKPAAFPENCKVFTGPAICFENAEEADAAIADGTVKAGHVMVIRNEGPRGGPAMREMAMPLKNLIHAGLGDKVLYITDGRFSGTNNGAFVGHICPEAAAGGPIALVKDGDIITIDTYKNSLTIDVNEEEFAKRRSVWKPRKLNLRGYLARYVELVSGANRGCILVPPSRQKTE
ncbi:MAG: dihydroxy-acid dehydratase [Treponema sp.]|jgi:dihydroxy-acid dehydratase|nr:dihydroxy-acid dehydratase [Treponema sp.]